MKTHLSCSDWVNSFRINLVSTTLVCISIPLPCPALLPLSAFRSLCPALLRKMFKNRLREYAQKNSWPAIFYFFFYFFYFLFFFTRPSVQRSILITSTEKHHSEQREKDCGFEKVKRLVFHTHFCCRQTKQI